MRILSFDIGIKNLAFCLLDNKEVLVLHNHNLLEEPPTCYQCQHLASYYTQIEQIEQIVSCKRHLPKSHPPLSLKSSMSELLQHLKQFEPTAKRQTKEKLWKALEPYYSIPIIPVSASKVSLVKIHDSLRSFVANNRIFLGANAVLLENQPAFKNPHMKSVQILLFATLREFFIQHGESPSFHFIHAKKKVQAEKGDAGYAERKLKSEERLEELFETGGVVAKDGIYRAWKEAKKKSDMSDALCMAVDFQKIA